ncbi:MAG TPA: sulfatase-like hydrolase/transferase [Devosia sp.]
MMSKPNILWIMADELRASALGCYGESWAPVATPNIDALAARGVLFTNNFCNSPVCVPSRMSILTAAPPERTGVYFNEGAWKSFPIPVRLKTFPEHFAEHGWRTATLGKSHYALAYTPWQEEDNAGSSMHGFGLETDPAALQPIVPRGIPSPVGGTFPSDRRYPPEQVTWNALRWLASAGNEPFLLRVSYLQPHTPVLPPQHFRDLYRAADWPGARLPRGYGSAYEEGFADMVGGREFSHEQVQQAQADYHALTTWLDTQVGLVLAALTTHGLAENTIVVFTSDHGASLGENGLFGKVVCAPQSQRTPFIVSWPGHVPEGVQRGDLTENMDLARTLCDLAGIAADNSFDGRSVFTDPAPDAVFATVGTGVAGAKASAAANRGSWRNGGGWPRRCCIRTSRWRFDMNTRQDGAPIAETEEDWFLADVEADPREIVNLAFDATHRPVVDELRARVLAHVARSVEPDFVPAFSEDEAPEFRPPQIAGA